MKRILYVKLSAEEIMQSSIEIFDCIILKNVSES